MSQIGLLEVSAFLSVVEREYARMLVLTLRAKSWASRILLIKPVVQATAFGALSERRILPSSHNPIQFIRSSIRSIP